MTALAAAGCVVVLVAVAGWLLSVTGALTLDLGVGRYVRGLGPLEVTIAAPRVLVFDQLALPYVAPTPPRAVRQKVTVVERTEGMVLAAHHTKVGPLTTTTLETVTLERPCAITFRLVRGPVPHVVERFALDETAGTTMVRYTGELGADLWLLGRIWSWAVARTWVATVAASLAAVQESAEAAAVRARARADT